MTLKTLYEIRYSKAYTIHKLESSVYYLVSVFLKHLISSQIINQAQKAESMWSLDHRQK